MKKYLVRNLENTVEVIHAKDINAVLPEGWTICDSADEADDILELRKRKKIDQIRARRDRMLKVHDDKWIIAQKDQADTTSLDADRQTLKDVPQDSQAYLDAETDVEAVKSFNPFEALELNEDYE